MPQRYDMDGREVQIEWQYATEPGGKALALRAGALQNNLCTP